MNSVLIVEDEKDIVDLVEYHLRQAGFPVISALDGSSGLEEARRKHPSLVILDLMLPGMNGKDVCRSLKSNPLTGHIPVLMLTARAEEVDRIIGFELGADDYVTKPFSPRELVLRVRAILRRGETDHESQRFIQIGDLLMDVEGHHVSVNKMPIHLTSIELKLLVELVSKRGRVQTRTTLLDRVWGYTYEGYERTVDTHIRRLREKLGDLGENIETLRGVGYRFRAETE
ncbi:MAG TPA: response regulator transcription factor [Thermodesulfobacteriota bacterium]|nr:response regulator transcription factor [Thermodesulfobacteriota bacterium]